MGRKGGRGWYCVICGEYKANEKFSGKGHARHICRKCQKLPKEKRQEIIDENDIMRLSWKLNQKQKAYLNKMRNDPRPGVRETADFAWNMRYAPENLSYDEQDYLFVRDEDCGFEAEEDDFTNRVRPIAESELDEYQVFLEEADCVILSWEAGYDELEELYAEIG